MYTNYRHVVSILSHKNLLLKLDFIVGQNLFGHRTRHVLHRPHVSSHILIYIVISLIDILLKLSSCDRSLRRLVNSTMDSQGPEPNGHLPPLAPPRASVTRAFIFVVVPILLLVFLMWLLRRCSCSNTKGARVVRAAPPNAPKTNTKQSYLRPGPRASEHNNAIPPPEATTKIELLCRQLAAMTIQRDEAVDLSKGIANERDKFKIMFGTGQKELKDSHVRVRSLNTEVNELLARVIGAKARNELLRDDMVADAEVAQTEKKEFQDKIDNLFVEKTELLKAAETENASLRQQVTSLQTENRKLQHSVMAPADKTQSLDIAETETAQAAQKPADEKLAAEKRTNQILKNKVTELEHAPSRNRKMFEAQIAQEQARIVKLEKELDGKIAEIKTKDSEIEEMIRGLEECHKAATTAADGQDDLDDLFTGTDEITKLEQELAKIKQEHVWELRGIRLQMGRIGESLLDKREADAKATIAFQEERIGQLDKRLE
ncbi:hypothetical protein HBH70_004860 [Parastagonospora nodorum]|nr:hypothetical protein HBH70_004860 [Parastagonospora nodorum]